MKDHGDFKIGDRVRLKTDGMFGAPLEPGMCGTIRVKYGGGWGVEVDNAEAAAGVLRALRNEHPCFWARELEHLEPEPKAKVFKHGEVWLDEEGDHTLVLKNGYERTNEERVLMGDKVKAALGVDKVWWCTPEEAGEFPKLVTRICTRDKWQRNRGPKKVKEEKKTGIVYLWNHITDCVMKLGYDAGDVTFMLKGGFEKSVCSLADWEKSEATKRPATPEEIAAAKALEAKFNPAPAVYAPRIQVGKKYVNRRGFVMECTQVRDGQYNMYGKIALNMKDGNDYYLDQDYKVDAAGKLVDRCSAWSYDTGRFHDPVEDADLDIVAEVVPF